MSAFRTVTPLTVICNKIARSMVTCPSKVDDYLSLWGAGRRPGRMTRDHTTQAAYRNQELKVLDDARDHDKMVRFELRNSEKKEYTSSISPPARKGPR